ncbi:type II secretion system F family protein [Vibrio agarivorans]|uniref:type II secretion system F family protein n=1 Tax=Vibrio agarivorans TaxID=153622 RepID=UPI0025B3D59E|nr:type II secretion system F family protein [Vibrio agarivorans]MDN3660957.1 type II secretion system F family protein [Vibrio agarivorans]
MIAWLCLIAGGVFLLLLLKEDKQVHKRYLESENQTVATKSMVHGASAINLEALSDETLRQKIDRVSRNINRQLGKGAPIKIFGFMIALVFLAIYLNNNFVRVHPAIMMVIVEIVGLYAGYAWLQKREKKHFEEAFPDALNMLTSAVSAGESLMHAIMFVGRSLEGEVGSEFKLMGERLQMGESPDTVFRKACKRFPYSEFHFFVITLRANMQRGGQLKDIITRLNRLMFDARSVEKKKYSLTAEARMSAKIVASIPFIFLFMLQYLSPENYEYVMFNPDGRYILYYVLISEFIGISIVWSLMKGVR